MRPGSWLALAVAASVQLTACTEHNPRYRPTVVTDGGGDDDQTPGADAAPELDGPAAPDAPLVPDGPPPIQDTASPEVVALPEVAVDLPPDAFVPPAGCGTGTTNVSMVGNADGVVVDTDGTIYTLTSDGMHSYVGRLPFGGARDITWRRVDDSPTSWGLALDSVNQRIFVLVASGVGALVRLADIRGAATGLNFYNPIGNGNDVVVGPGGVAYYTQQTDHQVYAVSPDRMRRKVTSPPVGASGQQPAALIFTPDGDLLVGLEQGPIIRLTLTNGVETGRTELVGWSGWANGFAYDHGGRLYVSQYHDIETRSVVRLDIQNNIVTGSTTIASGGRFSSIAFGRGPLDCRDLYVTDPWAAMRRVRVADSL